MSARDIPFDPSAICDNCDAEGAYDFMGDCYCGKCARRCAECEQMFIVDNPESLRTVCPRCSLNAMWDDDYNNPWIFPHIETWIGYAHRLAETENKVVEAFKKNFINEPEDQE